MTSILNRKEKETLHALGHHDWTIATSDEINEWLRDHRIMIESIYNRRICSICGKMEIQNRGHWVPSNPLHFVIEIVEAAEEICHEKTQLNPK